MKGLIIKDLLNLRKSLKTMLVSLLFFGFYSFAMKSPEYLLGIATFMLSIMAITSIAYDEASEWETFALATPLSRKQLVLSKYALAGLLILIGVLSSGLISLFIIIPNKISVWQLAIGAYIVAFIASLFIAILLPFVYKFGVEKARIVSITVFAIPAMLVFFLSKLNVPMPNANQLLTLAKFSPIFLILAFFISIKLSINFLAKKDI